jgi:flagellar basal-body rod protein FlgB
MLFQDPVLQAIGPYMSRLSQRQQIVASNLANIDTPGYKTKDVSFHATVRELMGELQEPLRTTKPGHLEGGLPGPLQAQPFEVPGLLSGVGQNNVDLDRELLKMSETSFEYSMIAQILKGKFHTISMSINGGKS